MKFVSLPIASVLMMASLVPSLGHGTNAAYAQDPSEWRAPGPAGKSKPVKQEKAQTHAASAPEGATPAPAAPAQQVYRIGTGDKLKVTIYNNEKLSGDYPVGGDGKIGLPMLGRVAVSGLTLDEVSTLLIGRLADGYFLNPNVTVDMAEYRPVYILGEVQKPGQYPYAEGMTVYRLVAQAGGYSYRANRKKMDVRPDNAPNGEPRHISDDALVQPGDTVIVRQRYF